MLNVFCLFEHELLSAEVFSVLYFIFDGFSFVCMLNLSAAVVVVVVFVVIALNFIHRPDLVSSSSYFFAPMELKSLSLATCAIRPWISSIDARLQSRVAFVSLSSVRFSFGSPPNKQMNCIE